MNLQEMIFSLSAALGPSGCEGEAVAEAERLLAPFVDGTRILPTGSVVGTRRSATPEAKTLLLDAHLDEVGMTVTGHDKGMLRFCTHGLDPRILPGLDVVLATPARERGVVTCLPPHLLTQEERENAFPVEKLRIDLGMTPEEAQRIPAGTRVCFTTAPHALAGTRICGKSLDDRCCFAALVRAMELLQGRELPVHVCVLGSVQEETTGLGAAGGAFACAPDAAIVTDVTFALQPDVKPLDAKPLGSGAAIAVGPLVAHRFSTALETCAKRAGIAHTIEVVPGNTGTNSMETQIAREGVPSMVLSVPLRYMHTPAEVVDLRDVEAVAQLIAAFVLSGGEGELL